jgi:hypothetical protein
MTNKNYKKIVLIFIAIFNISLLYSQEIVDPNKSYLELFSENELKEAWLPNSYNPKLPIDEIKQMFMSRYDRKTQIDQEFIKFNLLRGVVKQIELVWYDEKKEIIGAMEDYDYSNDRKYSHKIDDIEELTEWQGLLSSVIIRYYYGSKSYGGYGPGLNHPPHGIILYTEKTNIFVGLCPFGFHLGTWKGKKLNQEKLFYWPNVSYLLKKYVKKHHLKNFPNLNLYDLSGKIRFRDALFIEDTDSPDK